MYIHSFTADPLNTNDARSGGWRFQCAHFTDALSDTPMTRVTLKRQVQPRPASPADSPFFCIVACISALKHARVSSATLAGFPDDTEVDVKNLLPLCVCHAHVGEDFLPDIYCGNSLSVGKAVYSDHSVSRVRGWIMVCEASETDKLAAISLEKSAHSHTLLRRYLVHSCHAQKRNVQVNRRRKTVEYLTNMRWGPSETHTFEEIEEDEK